MSQCQIRKPTLPAAPTEENRSDTKDLTEPKRAGSAKEGKREHTMQATTKRRARQVQQALLALPDTLLLETIDQWGTALDEDFLEYSETDTYFEVFAYRVQSETTATLYPSLGEFFEAEPDADTFCWLKPSTQDLRTALEKMQPSEVYHVVVALAGLVFEQKPFAAHWAQPPGNHCDGYAFMQSLTTYLQLRKEGETLTTEQFEAQYEEQLEALAPQTAQDEDGWLDFSPFFSHESSLHFHITFTESDAVLQRSLVQALQRYDCTLSQTENNIDGSLSYVPWHQKDLRDLARVQRLLKRWQALGRITYTLRKEKPPKRRPSSKKHKAKGRQKKR